MSHHSRTTFVFGSELGSRLRQLRMRRGLSLRGLALLMDRRSTGSYNQMARLERGYVRHPTLNLIADYLRACGAGFEDLLDLLKAYTSQPPVLKVRGDAAVAELFKSLPGPEQRAMLKWERKVSAAQETQAAAQPGKKKPRVETDRQRVFRIVWSFIHANWNEVVEQKLHEFLVRFKDAVPRSERRRACLHGRKLFGVLTRYYQSDRRRQNALALAQRRTREDGFSDEVVAALLQAATDAHAELRQSGRLGWEPTQELILKARGHAPKVMKAETRMELDESAPVLEHNRALGVARAMVIAAVSERLDALKLDHYYVKTHYYAWIDRLLLIVGEHGTDSPEWQAEVDATAPRMHDEAFAREMAKLMAETFDRWMAKSPSRPKAP